eukprot:comp52682_c0_seq1/m.47696 comp52682_c0_seq1/g.47696  ORF comp52682_c0_seq1/g.47696 comp52682_c0_seq1/m.47696 type:complete len:189 (-) comp52682_c0_seq1:151-717(-)
MVLPSQMGALFARLFSAFKKPKRILMLGLDGAGKTTMLYRLQGEMVSTQPTIGFNVECVKFENVTLNVWDIGGQSKIRPLWRHYFEGAEGLIFVVDSSDHARIPEAAEELQKLLDDPGIEDAVVLILANKQDVAGAQTPQDLLGKLGLEQYQQRVWNMHATHATSEDGLYDALEWLVDKLEPHRRKQR